RHAGVFRGGCCSQSGHPAPAVAVQSPWDVSSGPRRTLSKAGCMPASGSWRPGTGSLECPHRLAQGIR
ncbi:hypothetical protein, partial [Acinetobacter baumannii]|uniref:hypothetical protein n=1 Tax=Acinetobacter baumannii TaxID=470 RepID=UPI0014878EF3